MSEQKAKKKDVTITINEAWCKGCVICVELCPESVLEMRSGKAKVAHLDQCSACMLCELRCPDFAIVVVDNSKVDQSSE